MITIGNRPVDIDPLIMAAETTALIASKLSIEDLVGEGEIMQQLYSQLSLYGASILGRVGTVIVFGDHAIGSDNSGTQVIDGNPLSITGRYRGINNVFAEEPVEFEGGIVTHVIPALRFEVSFVPMATGVEGTGKAVKFPNVDVPLLGQVPVVYEYTQWFKGSDVPNRKGN